ncbi:MAG: DUF4292 domain-containing protein [Bacteroidetes bacterium]|nr:DUF4292 domain-containing protein [Bacteroidota bacterium]
MFRLIFFLFILLLFQSCHRKITPILPPAPKSINVQEVDFDYLQGKARLIFRDNTKEREVKAHIRVRKDSVIWMKLTVIGIQGGSALINKDSITIVSDVQKEYYVFNYDDLSRRFNFNINYDVVQAALLGNLIISKRAQDEVTEDSFFNKLIQHEGSITIQNLIHKTTKKLERVDLEESGTGNTVKINYSDFKPLGDKLFPYKGIIEVLYKTASGIMNNTIAFEYIKAEVGTKSLRFHFKIPKRYDRR